MKIWSRFALMLLVLCAGTAGAFWTVQQQTVPHETPNHEPETSLGAEMKGQIGVTPDPCECPHGHQCIARPRVEFRTPRPGDVFRAGEAVGIEIFACDLHLLAGGSSNPLDYTTSLSVSCPGVQLDTPARTVEITPPAQGTCELLAVGYSGDFAAPRKSSSVEARLSIPVVAAAPSVAFTGPTPDRVIPEGNLVQLSATATDSDGSVLSVAFEVRNRNTQALVFSQVDSTFPYGANLPWTAPGDYVATARALDNDGNTSEASVQFSVNARPSLSFVQPTASSFTAPANIAFEVSAADADGSVTRVTFELLGPTGTIATSSDSLPPYTHIATALPQGGYTMRATAWDDREGWRQVSRVFTVATPPPVHVQMLPPDQSAYAAPADLTLRARVIASGLTPSRLAFQSRASDGQWQEIGQGQAIGGGDYSYVWTDRPIGSYQIRAKASFEGRADVSSDPQTFVVERNDSPIFVEESEKPKRAADYNEPAAYGQTYKSFLSNVFEPGQQMELEASFVDVNRNLNRIAFYMVPANEGGWQGRLLAERTFAVPGASSTYTFNTRITVTPEMVNHRMQRVFAVASDDKRGTGQSVHVPVAIRAASNRSQGCVPSSDNCNTSSGQRHRVPGYFMAAWYDMANWNELGQNRNRGLAGETYFDTSFLAPESPDHQYPAPSPIGVRGDDVSLTCEYGHWFSNSHGCAVRNREVGTFQTYRLEFQQAGAYELMLCFADSGQVRTSSDGAGEAGHVVNMQFENEGASGSWVQEVFGRIDSGGSAASASRLATEQGFIVPTTCPSELRRVSLLNGWGDPVLWPAGFQTRMRFTTTEQMTSDLIWLAMVPSEQAGPTRFMISSPQEGEVFQLQPDGSQPFVTLNTDLEKPRNGGTVRYAQQRLTEWYGIPDNWTVYPADGNRQVSFSPFPADTNNPSAPHRVIIRAALNWEDRTYYAPDRSFYVSDGSHHSVEWIGTQGPIQSVARNQQITLRMRAKFTHVNGQPVPPNSQIVSLQIRDSNGPDLANPPVPQRDVDQSDCPQRADGWQCFTAAWTVPNDAPAGRQYEAHATASSGQAWLTGQTSQPKLFRVAAIASLVEIDSPLDGARVPPNRALPLRARVVSGTQVNSVVFERCQVASEQQSCPEVGWSIAAAASLSGVDWTASQETPSVPSGQTLYFRYRVRANVAQSGGQPATNFFSGEVVIAVSDLPPNEPPSVAWMSPAAGATLAPGSNVELVITAMDPENQLDRVELSASRNGTVAWTARAVVDPADSKRWTHHWNVGDAGNWSITARAFDANTVQQGSASTVRSFVVASQPALGHETPAAVPGSVAAASDGVGATAGVFRVDESGAATYSIPIATVPGRAGVAPELALSYSSQGGMGAMGRGWSISGASAITRCRQTAEAGDADALQSGSPPLSFDASDRFCLDGQRLMLMSGSYDSGSEVMEFRTELDGFARIRGFKSSAANGPSYFVVQARDGTTAWYGDRISATGLPFMGNFSEVARDDASLLQNDGAGQVPKNPATLSFALARRMDSFGNYVDYFYDTDQATGEQVLSRVEFAGKTLLSDQTGSAVAPFAAVRFNYETLPAAQQRSGWQSGMKLRSTKRLATVDSIANLASNEVIRQYRLKYVAASSISAENVLQEVKECSGAGASAVCYAPTKFGWTMGSLTLNELHTPGLNYYSREQTKGQQLADVDGDGLLDLVWFYNGSEYGGACTSPNINLPSGTQKIFTGFGTVVPGQNSSSPPSFQFPIAGIAACSLRSYTSLAGAWYLFDYNADGRADLMLADRKPDGPTDLKSWQIYPSKGRVSGAQTFDQSFNNSSNPPRPQGLLSGCPIGNPAQGTSNDPDAANCLPVNNGDELLMQLADFNGDGLEDAVYGSPIPGVTGPHANVIKFKLRSSAAEGYRFSRAYRAEINLSGNDLLDACADAGLPPTPKQPISVRECRLRFLDASSRTGRSPTPLDVNGDGRGDLVFQVDVIYDELDPNLTCRKPDGNSALSTTSSMWAPKDQAQLAALLDAAGRASTATCVREGWASYIVAAEMKSINHSAQTISFDTYHAFESDRQPPEQGVFRGLSRPRPADFNGDGLPDLVFDHPWSGDRIGVFTNTGDGFLPHDPIAGIWGREYMQFLDFDGDGRVDLIYPSGTGDNSVWMMRRGTTEGLVENSAIQLPLFVSSNQFDFNPRRSETFFADFDGDGRTDLLELPRENGGTVNRLLRTQRNSLNGGAGRFKPLTQLSRIENGYGAVTQITYQPLTNGAVYLREPGSRAHSEHVGRGSAVHDLIGGMYVVSKVRSDAPGIGSTGRSAELFYQYRGARIQAGGRGSLGFREVRTLDANFADSADSHVVSITEYGLSTIDPEAGSGPRYGFPFIGMPRESRQYLVNAEINADLRTCLEAAGEGGGPEALPGACFNAGGLSLPNPFFSEPQGILLSYARNRLESAVTQTGVGGERSVFAYIKASFEAKGNPESKSGLATLSETVNYFDYNTSWGDLDASAVGTSRGLSYPNLEALRVDAHVRLTETNPQVRCGGNKRCVTRVNTANTYIASSQPTAANDRDYWRLGRLEQSDVTHWRRDALSTIVRRSRFGYDLSSAARTGVLNLERVAGLSGVFSANGDSGDPSELRTVRTHDHYGNVIDTFMCSGDVSDSDCRNPGAVKQRPAAAVSDAALTRVHRHSMNVYDTAGRYLIETQAPHYRAEGPQMKAPETIVTRDLLGNVTQSNDYNGGQKYATYGAMGRQQTASSNRGGKTVSEFHWCSPVNGSQFAACPSDIGAVFRQTAYAEGGTRSVTYFDKLGREVFALTETFNRYDESAANDWVGVCKTYDGRGRTVKVTEPFFQGNVATNGLRPELSGAVGCDDEQTRYFTRTAYDVLDRPTSIKLPEHRNSTSAVSLFIYDGLQTTTRNRISRPSTPFDIATVEEQEELKTVDASGQVVSVRDAGGMTAYYDYDAVGNLVALRRDAGRGEIVSHITYDALGRKTGQVDPDAGTASYAYNAAGELICSRDARGHQTVVDIDALGRSWRSRTWSGSCPTTADAWEPTDNQALAIPNESTGKHASVDLTVYDTAGGGLGQIATVQRWHRVGALYTGYRSNDGAPGVFSQSSVYDGLGRIVQIDTTFKEPNLGGSGLRPFNYTQHTTYDSLGRVATSQDATGGVVENMYSAHGFLRRIRDHKQASLVYWELLGTDERGQTTLDRRHGNVALTQQRQYDPVSGRLNAIRTGLWSGGQISLVVQNLSYAFDPQGNLLSRTDQRSGGMHEAFQYDKLNRLLRADLRSNTVQGTAPGLTTLTLSYDKLGNICSKNGQGYTYLGRAGCGLPGSGTAGTGFDNAAFSPHAVTSRGSLGYQYDLAGNMTHTTGHDAGPGMTASTRVVRFDGAGNADRLSISDQATSFWYGPGGRYLRIEESNTATAKLTRYAGGVEWTVRNATEYGERKRYIGGFLVLTETGNESAPPTRKYSYLLTDHLGSTDTLVDETGNVRQRLSFDAHGSRRNVEGEGVWASLLPVTPSTSVEPTVAAETPRGFTGHEHIDRMGLVHMNGRLYDPLLGRMISPDPIVQEPYNAQNLNRYSYVLNNPLSYTDPSGLSFVKKYWRAIVAAAITIFAPYLGAWTTTWWGAATVGFVSGTVATGSLEGGLWGAFSAGIFNKIGGAFQGVADANPAGLNTIGKTGLTSTQFAGKVLSHAAAGGVMSAMQGGKFGHGFASAGITQAFAPGIDRIDASNAGYSASRVIAAAVIGGTASVASGGKFANGALTAAFSRAFNHEAHSRAKNGMQITEEEQALLNEGTKASVIKFYESRLARGDGYAKLALAVVTNYSDSEMMQSYGRLANAQLGIEVGMAIMDGKIDRSTYQYDAYMEKVNVGLARAHADAVRLDRTGVPGLLSADQIMRYHQDYFVSIGLSPNTFGGQLFGYNNNRAMRWCQGCDSE